MELLRHISIGLIALSLTIGTGWQSCATLQQKNFDLQTSTDGMALHHAMGHADHMASADHTDTKPAPSSGGHACLKCCGACMLGSVAQKSPEWTVARLVSRVIFPLRDAQLRGQILFVDPDIPKSVV